MLRVGKSLLLFIRILFLKWSKDDVARLAAALAFFTTLSLAPLLLIATVIAGALLEQGTLQREVTSRAEQLAGDEVAGAVGSILENATLPESGLLVTLVAFLGFAFAGSNAFFQLQRALDEVWGVAVQPKRALRATIRKRLEALLIVIVVGLLLVASPVLRLLTNGLERGLNEWFSLPWLWWILDPAITVLLFTLLIGVTFKVVPSARITWRAVAGGAFVTAILFTLGAAAMAYYLESSATASLYGAAGSLMALFLWIYVSAHILLIGAEITQIYARYRGEPIVPYRFAVSSEDERDRKRKRVDELLLRLTGEEESRGPKESIGHEESTGEEESIGREGSKGQEESSPRSRGGVESKS